MKFHVFNVGKPKSAALSGLVEKYVRRINHTSPCDWVTVKATDPQSAALELKKRSGSGRIIVLDEKGESPSSVTLARRFERWEGEGVREVSFWVGGAEGHADQVRQNADWIWSLSPLTLQHDVALLVLVEQIYRTEQIRLGTPYHRGD
ncbi:MAG: 23S rRNA (pseudouridine(1915)-N(3))-methyltransferase RlmH [Candidatus Methylacidiphilales bacterium]